MTTLQTIGFTGSRWQIIPPQARALASWMLERPPGQAHHGDCVGRDEAVHRLAKMFGWRVVVHPGTTSMLRAYVEDYDEIRPVKPNLDRNAEIVMETAALVALPSTVREEQRSGTWATVRFARKQGRPIYIIWPDGELSYERPRNESP